MASRIEDIAKEVLGLPRQQRLEPIRLLLQLDQPGTGDEIETRWDEEIAARVKAVDEGRVAGIAYATVKDEVATHLTR